MGQDSTPQQSMEVTVRLTLEEVNAIVRSTKIKNIETAVHNTLTIGLWLMGVASFSLKTSAKANASFDAPILKPRMIVDGDATDGGMPPSIKNTIAVSEKLSRGRHISRDEWKDVVAIANTKGDAPVSQEEAEDFWIFIADKMFVNSLGFTITRSNVGNTFAAWRQLRRKEERRNEKLKAETIENKQIDEETHDRRNRFMLTDVPED